MWGLQQTASAAGVTYVSSGPLPGFDGALLRFEPGQHLGALEIGPAAHLVVCEQAAALPLVDGLGAHVEHLGGLLHGEQVDGWGVGWAMAGCWLASWRKMARRSSSGWA